MGFRWYVPPRRSALPRVAPGSERESGWERRGLGIFWVFLNGDSTYLSLAKTRHTSIPKLGIRLPTLRILPTLPHNNTAAARRRMRNRNLVVVVATGHNTSDRSQHKRPVTTQHNTTTWQHLATKLLLHRSVLLQYGFLRFLSHEIQLPASASPARSCWRLHGASARRRQRH